jgi:glycosylphosphatidylinositol transamidase (GPIT) subunit GPI8
MIVIIEERVHQVIDEFYYYALTHHEALDYETVIKKINRLYDALESLSVYGQIYPKARLKEDWILHHYKEFIYEDFHFAFQIYEIEDGEKVVRVHDACHSLMYIG